MVYWGRAARQEQCEPTGEGQRLDRQVGSAGPRGKKAFATLASLRATSVHHLGGACCVRLGWRAVGLPPSREDFSTGQVVCFFYDPLMGGEGRG